MDRRIAIGAALLLLVLATGPAFAGFGAADLIS